MRRFQVILLSSIFIYFVILAVAFRDYRLILTLSSNLRFIEVNSEFTDVATLCGDLPTCFRVTGSWIGFILQKLLFVVGDALNLKASFIPWSKAPILSLEAKQAFLSLVASLLYRLLVLAPILFVALSTFEKFVSRFFFLLITFLAISGWTIFHTSFSDVAINLYGWAGTRRAVDQEVIFLFGNYLIYYDYYAVGFLYLLYLYLTRVKQKRFWHVSCLLVLGQTGFDHLGFITGTAAVLHGILTVGGRPAAVRVKVGLKELTGYGLVSVGAFFAMFLLLNATNDGIFWNDPGGTVSGLYENFGRKNLGQLRPLILKICALLIPPLLAGIVLGAGSAALGDQKASGLKSDLAAATSIFVGFLGSVCVGLFVSGFYSELGRQLMPFGCVMVLLAAKAGAFAVVCVRPRASQ